MVHVFFGGDTFFSGGGEGKSRLPVPKTTCRMPKISNMTYRHFLWNFYLRELLNFNQQPLSVTTFLNANGF